jgi:uncharacterized protein (DUF433 family)
MRVTAPETLLPGAPDPESGSWIRKTPGVCGGDACIRNTRITVWGLVEWRRLELSDDEIMERVTGVTRDDLAMAWEYYRTHREEVDNAIEENEAA